MPNYKGKRPGTRRVVIWAKLQGESRSKPHEWVIRGSKKDGDAFEAAKQIELNSRRRVELRTAPTFVSFCVEHYKPHAKAHLKASTWDKVRTYQVETLCKHFGDIKLSELTVLDVERFKSTRNVGPTAVNNELRILRTILNYAETLGVAVPKLKWKRLPVRGKGRVRVWTASQVAALFDKTRTAAPELLPILIFMLNTGVRKGEAIACEWDWIDFKGAMIRIPSNDYWQPKNGLPREVPMGDIVRAILSGPRKHARWVFPNRFGGRYVDFPKDLFWKARNEAGLSGGPHTTRHTFASHFLYAVPDLRLLADVMGHSVTKVTELYTHLLPGHLEKARNAVNLSPTMALTMAEKKK